MTPTQRYLFDLNGYLHLKNVLSGTELKEAQDAVERCIKIPPDQLPHDYRMVGIFPSINPWKL